MLASIVVMPALTRVMTPVVPSMVATAVLELLQVKVAVLLLVAVGRLAAGVSPKITVIMSWSKLTALSSRSTLTVSSKTALMPATTSARMRRTVAPAVVGVPVTVQALPVVARVRPALV